MECKTHSLLKTPLQSSSSGRWVVSQEFYFILPYPLCTCREQQCATIQLFFLLFSVNVSLCLAHKILCLASKVMKTFHIAMFIVWNAAQQWNKFIILFKLSQLGACGLVCIRLITTLPLPTMNVNNTAKVNAWRWLCRFRIFICL